MSRAIRHVLIYSLAALIQLSYVDVSEAAFNRQLYYSIEAEANSNSDEEDETFSTLSLDLDDDFYLTQFQGEYELNADYFNDHSENLDNDQYEGRLNSKYVFLKSGFWWDLDALAEVIPVETGVDIDEFESQNVTTVTTGPVLSIQKGLRGSLDLALQATIQRYSAADLDSNEKGALITYNYPVSSTEIGGFQVVQRDLEFEDSINSSDDYELTTAGLFYESRGRDLSYTFRVATNEVDAENGTDTLETYRLTARYQVNTSSAFHFEVSELLQNSSEFNRLPGNLEDSIFEAGLLLNERREIGYDYTYKALAAGVLLFSNEFENLVSESDFEVDSLEGWQIFFFNRFNLNWSLEVLLESTTTISEDLDEDSIETTLRYIEEHSKYLSSNIELFAEKDKGDEVDFENVSITYRLVFNILR